ncbi:MAG: CRISPR-associated endonuclease Cas1 [Verrucomicrobiota bacterium]|jgi:CRISPR-associated protein Cas1
MNDQDPAANSAIRNPKSGDALLASCATGRPTEPNPADNAARVGPAMKPAGEPPSFAKDMEGRPALPPNQVKILVRLAPAEAQPGGPPAGDEPTTPHVVADKPDEPTSTLPGNEPAAMEGRKLEIANDPIPSRMMNEFVYCPRLFYYEFVEGVFVESADTMRGDAIHRRVDSGSGELPAAKRKSDVRGRKSEEKTGARSPEHSPKKSDASEPLENRPSESENEVIHSRSVQMGSERLGIVAKMDLVEVRAASGGAPVSDPARSHPPTAVAEDDLFSPLEVCPVDYKAGAPKPGENANDLWDTDKMQLGLQALILRDNGYLCHEGVIYYRATKQRVHLPITPELESWILQKIAEAKRVVAAPIPAPLVHSPKCVRCSLAPVCLPDETRMLAQTVVNETVGLDAPATTPGQAPRRLIAARDDTRPLYLNTPGYRVGCKDEVLQVKDRDAVIDEVRMRDVSHVALFGNIQISTQAIQSLCEQEIPVTYFSMGGWFYGITRGHGLKNVFLRMEQFRLGRDEKTCLALARQFVHGKIRNHRTMLMRNHLEPPEAIIGKLKRASEDALQAGSLAELLGIEGAAASQYFQQFSGMVKVEDDLPGLEMPVLDGPQRAFNFNFNHRNRRPPTDPVNSMLSLAYSVLAKDCLLAALAVGFDPYLGFYHQPRFGRPALGLDLMEEFRPLIAESTVLNCINNRVVTEKDFVRAGQAVNLTAPGRKRFFQTYEQRMSSLITHPLFDYKVSYRRALELQARLLAKTLTGEIAEYIPLMTR